MKRAILAELKLTLSTLIGRRNIEDAAISIAIADDIALNQTSKVLSPSEAVSFDDIISFFYVHTSEPISISITKIVNSVETTVSIPVEKAMFFTGIISRVTLINTATAVDATVKVIHA